MKILTVAYPFTAVGLNSVGGAEQVAFHIAEALRIRGHESLLLAREDSEFSGTLSPIPRAIGPLNERSVREPIYRLLHQRISETDADLIHFHGIDFFEYLPAASRRPTLVTLHLPIDWYPRHALAPSNNLHFNCVSDSQFNSCPAGFNVSIIPNGVPMPSFRVWPKKRNFALSLGRICPEKGFHMALAAAARTQTSFILAGEVFPYDNHQRYFRNEIVPRLSRERRFIGSIGGVRKYRLLAAAKCLVIPSLVNETSSLVAMEAMACGTPVIAFRRGALDSIVQDCRTGFLVDNETEIAAAIHSAPLIQPEVCREFAYRHFSLEKMIREYLHLYQDLYLKGQPHPPACAKAVSPS